MLELCRNWIRSSIIELYAHQDILFCTLYWCYDKLCYEILSIKYRICILFVTQVFVFLEVCSLSARCWSSYLILIAMALQGPSRRLALRNSSSHSFVCCETFVVELYRRRLRILLSFETSIHIESNIGSEQRLVEYLTQLTCELNNSQGNTIGNRYHDIKQCVCSSCSSKIARLWYPK